MASTQKIMHDITGASERARNRNPDAGEPAISIADDAARKQIKFLWLESTMTKEFIKSLGKEAEDCINTAISLSVAYPTTQNHQQIIHNLIRANQIRNIINKYAKPE